MSTRTAVVETLASDARVGMVRQWNQGTSTITAIVPEGRVKLRITYRNDTARPDGKHNTVTLTTRKDSWLPIVSA